MRKITFLLSTIMILISSGAALGEEQVPSPYWDAFLDVGYRFTLLPGDEVKDILRSEGAKYKQSLGAYIKAMESGLTEEGSGTDPSMAGIFPSSIYRRLAVANLLVYLATEKEKYLDRAFKRIDHIAKRRATPRTIFWHNLILAHKSILKKDSVSFTYQVYNIWNDVIQVLEAGQVMFGTTAGVTGFNNSLPYLYENIIHLTLTQAIVKHKLPNLHAVGTIIWAMRDRLEKDKGYYQLAESVWNRMDGVISDNFSINFAMTFLEGETHWINFEGARTSAEAANAYAQARTYFNLAMEWSSSSKGKAAVLTKRMEMMIRILNAKIKGKKIVSHPSFTDVKTVSSVMVNTSRELFLALATEEAQKEGWWEFQGFKKPQNYVDAMHNLWSTSSQLDIMLSRYYKKMITRTKHPIKKLPYITKAAKPLQNYLDFFEKTTKDGYKNVIPDHAYFYAAYFASELAELHQQKASYSEDVLEYDYAFARQLQAIEIFPFDIMGLLKLSMQVSQEGTLNTYMDNVWPMAGRFASSKTVLAWAGKKKLKYASEVKSLTSIIPEAIRSAPSVIGLQGNDKSGNQLIRETLLMTQLIKVLLQNKQSAKVDLVLSEISKGLKKDNNINRVVKRKLSPKYYRQIQPYIRIIEKSDYPKLKKALFRNPEDANHTFLRQVYHEVDNKDINYLKMLNKIRDKEQRRGTKGIPMYRKRVIKR